MNQTIDTTGPRPGERRLELPNFHHRVICLVRGHDLVAECWAAAGTNDVHAANELLIRAYDVDGCSGIRMDRDDLDEEIDALPMLATMRRFEVVKEPDDLIGVYLRGWGTFTGPSAAETRARIEAIQAAHGRCAEECPGWSIEECGDDVHDSIVERCDACLAIADGSVWPVTVDDIAALPEAIEAVAAANHCACEGGA